MTATTGGPTSTRRRHKKETLTLLCRHVFEHRGCAAQHAADAFQRAKAFAGASCDFR